MARCNKIGNKNNVVCIGDMNRKVDLLVKTLTPSGDSGVDYSLTYTVVDTIWAVIRTDEEISSIPLKRQAPYKRIPFIFATELGLPRSMS